MLASPSCAKNLEFSVLCEFSEPARISFEDNGGASVCRSDAINRSDSVNVFAADLCPAEFKVERGRNAELLEKARPGFAEGAFGDLTFESLKFLVPGVDFFLRSGLTKVEFYVLAHFRIIPLKHFNVIIPRLPELAVFFRFFGRELEFLLALFLICFFRLLNVIRLKLIFGLGGLLPLFEVRIDDITGDLV